MEHSNSLVAIVFLFVLVAVIIPLPSWVAALKKHPNKREIYILNIVLIWTAVGWLALIAWAFSGIESETLSKIRKKRGR